MHCETWRPIPRSGVGFALVLAGEHPHPAVAVAGDGVGDALENLIRLSQDGARIYIRIPTIKEVNGNEENMKETIAFLKEHDIHPAGVNLLPYHDTGSGKYAKLDMEYKGTDLHAPDKEEMEAFAALFVNAGFTNTKIGG